MSLYETGIFPALKHMDAEHAHRLAISSLSRAQRTPGGLRLLQRLAPAPDPRLRINRFGLVFANPLGVAAGLDKDAEAVRALFALGFGSVEIGTVTPRSQPGNERPRVWRVPGARGVINAMGFPSGGAAAVRANLAGNPTNGIVGINIGKNKLTTVDDTIDDYLAALAILWDQASYVVINVSSPNTPGLRDLQQRETLTELLRAVQKQNREIAGLRNDTARPILVKLAPDMTHAQIDEALQAAFDSHTNGIILTNTTTSRHGVGTQYSNLPGGLSGAPLRVQANEMVRLVAARMGSHQLPIIGVGGISTASDVIERIRAGASLTQLYTAFVYGGPGLPGRILRDLTEFLDREGIRSIEELIGQDSSQ